MISLGRDFLLELTVPLLLLQTSRSSITTDYYSFARDEEKYETMSVVANTLHLYAAKIHAALSPCEDDYRAVILSVGSPPKGGCVCQLLGAP
jgi:hypothetical protein